MLPNKLFKIVVGLTLASSLPVFADSFFAPGNLVVTVEGNGVQGAASGSYTDNQAGPLTLFQFKPNGTSAAATYVNSLVLPQTASGSNLPVSGEYGSSSEGTLQLSGNGQYLTVMGYGVNAAAFNANPGSYSPDPTNTALGQSGSVQGQGYTAVPRVTALIDANGNVNSSTATYGVFSANNPRSAYTQDGQTIYISGQGTKGDNTGGVFVTQLGSQTATSITGTDAGSGASQDTREVQIYNNTLYVSVDSKSGSTNRSYIGTLGNPPATSTYNSSNGPTQLNGFGTTATGKYSISNGDGNTINANGDQINLSPENYFFANPNTLYVADSGDSKQTSATSSLGDGGLQKWSLNNGTWVLDYTLSTGLNLVPNTDSDGSSGLYGLTGEVIGGNVELFATNYTLADTDPTFLYGITDTLADTLPSQVTSETFTELAAAPADSNFKGVAFAPVAPEPAPFALLGVGLLAVGLVYRRRKAA